jgi:hypothetical protein
LGYLFYKEILEPLKEEIFFKRPVDAGHLDIPRVLMMREFLTMVFVLCVLFLKMKNLFKNSSW